MERRQFLGAAAALTTLPAVSETGDAERADQADPEDQASSESFGRSATGAGYIELNELVEEGAEVRVRAYHYPDEASVVEAHVGIGGGGVTLSFTADEADDLADRLASAAAFAREGSR